MDQDPDVKEMKLMAGKKKRITQGKKWKRKRSVILRFYGYQCMKCGEKKGKMHVDHIFPLCQFPELAYDWNNLQVLCQFCNSEKGISIADYRPPHMRLTEDHPYIIAKREGRLLSQAQKQRMTRSQIAENLDNWRKSKVTTPTPVLLRREGKIISLWPAEVPDSSALSGRSDPLLTKAPSSTNEGALEGDIRESSECARSSPVGPDLAAPLSGRQGASE